MKQFVKKIIEDKRIAACLIAVLTVAYLLGTAAFAQNDTLASGDNIMGLDYTKDPLSFGDIWMFDKTFYDSSRYAGPAVNMPDANSYTYHTSKAGNNGDTATITFYAYFSEISFADHAAATTTGEVSVIAYDQLYGGFSYTEQKVLNGEKIITAIPETDTTAKYTVIPDSVGNYRIYVYSENDPSTHVGYFVINDVGTNNQFAGGNLTYPQFSRASEKSNWWYTTVEVGNIGWTAAYPSCTNHSNDQNDPISDTLPDSNFASKLLDAPNLLLLGGSSNYFYNKWSAQEVQFNTLITIQWSGDIQLGTIVREIDIELNGKTNTDDYKGETVLADVFGECFEVADGVLTKKMARVQFEIVATPDDKEVSVLDAIEGVTNCVLEEGWYTPGNVESLAIGLRWTRFIPMPDVCVSYDDESWNGDFYAKNGIGIPTDMNEPGTYMVTLDFSKCSENDITGVDYVVTQVGNTEPIKSGELVSGSNSFEVDVVADNITVSLTTKGTEVTRTCTISFLPGVPGLDQNVKNLTTGVTYQFIEDALEAAKSDETIVLLGDVSFRKSGQKNSWGSPTEGGAGYTVKQGVTLLLPYAAGQYDQDGTDESFPYANYNSTNGTIADLDPEGPDLLYLTLTVPEGIVLQNNGTISIGGTVDAETKQGYGGVCSGAHSNIKLDGDLNLGSTGILSVVGFIIGDGSVYVTPENGGAKVYQLFSVMDYRGGSYCLATTSTFATDIPQIRSNETSIAAFNRMALLGIQTKLVLQAGNELYGYCDLYADGKHNATTSTLVSTDKNNAILALHTGATLTAEYLPDTTLESFYASEVLYPLDKIGKTKLTISGGADLGSLTLTVKYVIDVEAKSSASTFNLPYNFDIVLVDGTYNIGNSMALLPGASVTIRDGATLNVNNRLHVYSGLVDARKLSSKAQVVSDHIYWSKTAYPSTAQLQSSAFKGNGSANLIVDGGTLNLNKSAIFSGLVQTAGSGTMYVDSGATVQGLGSYHQFGVVGVAKVKDIYSWMASFTSYNSGACLYTNGGQIVNPETGELTQLAAGTYNATPYSSAIGSYSYTMYINSEDTSANGQIVYTEALGASVQGAWYIGSTNGGKLPDSSGAVAKVSNDAGKEEYYSSLQAAVSAAEDDDKVTLLASITLSQPISSASDITLDLGEFAINCSNGFLVNNGELTLTLNDSTINSDSFTDKSEADSEANKLNVPCITNLAGGNLTLQLGSASINWGSDQEFDVRTSVIVNYGTMSITGGAGLISMSDRTTGAIERTGHTIHFAAVVRNEGTLSISSAAMTMTQATNGNSAVILNHKGTIELLSSSTITHANGYGLYNLGGTVTNIFGGTIKGQYGIKNQNITGGKASVGEGLFVTHEARIDDIRNTNVEVTEAYALINYAAVGTIGGTASFKAPKLAIYNTANWYYDTANYKTAKIDGLTHYYYNLDTLPSINLITDSTSITVTGSKVYAIRNQGYIGTINGNVKIIAGSITDEATGTYTYTGYGMYVYGTGQVNEISGNVVIAAMQYGIRVDSSYDDPVYYTEAYSETVDGIKTTYYIGWKQAAIQTITGSVSITTSSTNGLYISNGGYVGSISGNVGITSSGNALVLTGQATTQKQSWTTEADSEGKYQVYSVTFYEIHSGISSIDGDTAGTGVVITTSSADYPISNAGSIGSIHGKVTLTSGYRGALYNHLTPAYEKYTYIRYYDANGVEYQRDWNYDFNYKNASQIGSIGGNEGDEITISASRYGIYNCGYIGLVGKGVTVSAKGSYGAIYNYPERRLSRYGTGTWETLTGYTDTSAEGKIQTTVYWTYTCDGEYYPSTIEIIDGATIKNTKNYAINNSGYIGVITNCTISAANSAIYNNPTGPYDGELKKVACYTYSSVTTSTSYDNVAETILSSVSAQSRIGVIDNCTITASTSYAINNCGYVGYIQNSTLTAKANTIYQGDASTTSYKVTNEEYLVRGTTGKYAFTSSPTKQYTYQLAEINTIGAGNTIKSTNSSTVGPAIANSGIIDTINGNVQVSWTVTDGVVSAFTEQEATNKPTLILSSYSSGINNYGGHETSTAATLFESARIGTIKNVSIEGKTYGIVNGDGTSSSYTVTIGEIGEGVVAVATASTGYGLYNADQYATITLISGGDYYSGAKVRDNAIYQPDKQSYLTDCHALSTETRKVTANGKEYACYYIVATHTWKDCACEDCKIMKFYATNVRMGNSLDILFAFPKSLFPDGTDWSGYYAEFTRVGRDPMKIYFSDWDTMMIGKVECYVVTYNGFAAKEMGDSVAVSLYDASGNRISLSKTDSIQAYAMRMLNKNSGNKTLQTAIVDMLNYGAACQNHFSYRVDSLANALLSDAQKDYATASPKDVADVDEQLAVAREKSKAYFKSNLITDSNIKFTMAFHKGMFTEITYKFIGHKNNEVETTVTADEMTASGNYLLYSIPELVVADARCTIEVTVTLSNGNTETWGESIEAYIARNATDEDGDVYYAFMTFADSAEAYLHSEEVVK